ncbi:MAG TPA: CDP-alcohol phosphatidyltransferase family protein [Saliniramus sp.]|nr:CDP-alcohol phosphatidyltransferase family protein [Saliniramus sp.]
MLDGLMRRLIDPPLDRIGRVLARGGVSADQVTFAGLILGLACAAASAVGAEWLARAGLARRRSCDGLDGAVARAGTISDRGGFLDIVFDFIFYGAVPLAFALRDPDANAIAATVLLFTFYVNGASFLAFAAVAAKRGMTTQMRGVKSIYFTAGLAEGSETIIAFALMIAFAQHFPLIAYFFAGLTLMSAIARIALAYALFADEGEEDEAG